MTLIKSERIPTKQSINLATVGLKKTNWTVMMPLLCALVIVVAVFAKSLVYDRLAAVSAAESAAASVQIELDECKARIAEYGELNEVYAHYTYSGMTEEELALVDRAQVMELLERAVLPKTQAAEWELADNRLTIAIEGETLQEINDTVQALLAEEMVDYCEVHTATTNDLTKRGNGTIRYEHYDTDKVIANIVIHLTKQEKEAQ